MKTFNFFANVLFVISLFFFSNPTLSAQRAGGASLDSKIKGHNVGKVIETYNSIQTEWIQTANKTWQMKNATGKVVGTYTETGRDEWSVYLQDNRPVKIQIDLWQKRVYDKTRGTQGDITKVALRPVATPKPKSKPTATTKPIVAPNLPNSFVRIENRWKPGNRINIEKGPLVFGQMKDGAYSAMWTFKKVATNYFRIVNRWKPNQKLHIEHGKLECSKIKDGAYSAMWIIEPVPNTKYFRIVNRWKPEQKINIEKGSLVASKIHDGAYSAMWIFKEVNPSNPNNNNTATNNNNNSNNNVFPSRNFRESDLSRRNILGNQPLTSSTPPARNNKTAKWNYRGNLNRREINANGLGRCYDVRKMDLLDWTSETLRSGQTSYAFEFYRDDSKRPARFNNRDLVVPFGVTFQSALKSDAEEQYKFVVTAHEFESEVTQEYRANVGVPKLGSASVSVGFKNSNSNSNRNENMYTFTKMYKQLYKLDLELDNPSYKHQVNDRFWDAVRKLGYSMSANDFINKFGTHIASSTFYGGNYLQRRSVSKNQYATSTSNEREFKADVEATIKGVTVGVGTTQGNKNSSSNSKKIVVSNKKVFTIGGNPSFDNPRKWANSVMNLPEVIKGRLTPITALLNKKYFPNIPNIDNKRKLLELAIKKAVRDAANQLSRPTNHSFYSKTAVKFRLTVWNMKCTGQGSSEAGSASEYYGKLAMGFFAKNRRQVNGKTIWDQNDDHTVDFTTNQTRDMNKTLEMTILPVDFAEGYAKIWGWMKEDDSPDTKLSSYSESVMDGAIRFSSAMSLNNPVPGQLTFTSSSGDSVTVSYELKRIK